RLALGILSCYAAWFTARPAVLFATRSARRYASPGAGIATPQHGRLPEAFPHTLLSDQLRGANIDDFCNRRLGFLGISLSTLSESKSRCGHDHLRLDHRSGGFGLDASWRRDRRPIALAFWWFVLLGLRNRNADRVSVFYFYSFRFIFRGVGYDVLLGLFFVFFFLFLKHPFCQRLA